MKHASDLIFYYLGGNACSMRCRERDWYEYSLANDALSITSAEYMSLNELVASSAWYKHRDWRGSDQDSTLLLRSMIYSANADQLHKHNTMMKTFVSP